MIGGTSFAGGMGRSGRVFGAILMQALAFGLGFLEVEAPMQDIFAGTVLVRSRPRHPTTGAALA